MSQPHSSEVPELTIDGQLYLKCACGDLYPAKSYGAGFMVANDGVCENCDAEQVAIPGPVARNLLGELYQVLGALDAGAKVLDQVSAAIHGQPLPHETLLPYAQAVQEEAPKREGEAQGAMVGDERSRAEQAYVENAFDYSAAPISSRDWTLYWKGWQARSSLATQPAAIKLPPPPYVGPEGDYELRKYEQGELQGRCDMWELIRKLNAPPAAAQGNQAEHECLGYIEPTALLDLLQGSNTPTTIRSAIPSLTNPAPVPGDSWAVPIYVVRRPGEPQ